MNDLPRSRAWWEVVAYIECPWCGEIYELGAYGDVHFSKDDEYEMCIECHHEFVCEAPSREPGQYQMTPAGRRRT